MFVGTLLWAYSRCNVYALQESVLLKVVILFGAFVALLTVSLTACGGSSAPAESDARPASSPDAADQAAAPAESLLLDISVNGEDLEYDKSEMSAPAGQEVTVQFRNVSKAQPHNWVLVENGTKDDVTADGIESGEENDYVTPGDERVFAQTGLLAGKETGKVTFTVPPAGTYQFVCTFPAHNITMFGTFTSTP